MQASTRTAIKNRTKKWELEHRQMSQRGAQDFALSRLKCEFMEDLLRLHQQELEFQLSTDRREMRVLEREMAGEIETLSEVNKNLTRQVKGLQEELSHLRRDKEEGVQQATTNFHRVMQRHQDRNTATQRQLENEKDMLLGKVKQLEALVAEQRAVDQAESAVEIMELRYHIEDIKAELADRTRELEQEQAQRHSVEDQLLEVRQQLQHLVDFVDALDETADRVNGMMSKSQTHHAQLVESLLSGAHLSSGDRPIAKDSVERGAQLRKPGGSLFLRTNASATEDNQGKMKLTPAQRLGAAMAKLEGLLESQQVELALATRCALDAFERTMKDNTTKLRASYAHCELQLARIADLERQRAEHADYTLHERDRALNQRDQALVQARAVKDAKQAKICRHVETQTFQRPDKLVK